VTGQVTDQIETLLKAVSGEKTKKELMQLLSLSGRDNFEKLYLKPAIELELLELTIPEKPKSRLQKYRLTELGKQILELKKAGN
jgi:ATP-dependent DNA helicase RecG